MPSVCFYFEVHQPYRLKPYGALQVGRDHQYFDDRLNAQVLRKVAELLPDDLAPAFECGIAARKADAIPEALDFFSRCLALQPDHAAAHTQYAKTLDLAGLYEDALEHTGDEADFMRLLERAGGGGMAARKR